MKSKQLLSQCTFNMFGKSSLNPHTKIVIMFEIEENIIKKLFFFCSCLQD